MLKSAFVAATALFALSTAAIADTAGIAGPQKFPGKTGKELYETICQACHMPGGVGAVGAGFYPALAKNEKLAAAGYPVYVVLFGFHGMPPFGHYLDDDQIAAVVNYIRTNFGNVYDDKVTPADVKNNRDPNFDYPSLD